MLATSPKAPCKPRRAFVDAALTLDKLAQRLIQKRVRYSEPRPMLVDADPVSDNARA